jgi:hypothetical protein
MARPLPVNMLLAGTGAVLLISGIGGETLGEVLQGQFGALKGEKKQATATEAGQMQNASLVTGEGGESPESQTSPSSSTFAPSPSTLGLPRHSPTKAEQAQGIAHILLSHGILHPTNAQVNAARQQYEKETGIRQFNRAGENAPEFAGGLPVI